MRSVGLLFLLAGLGLGLLWPWAQLNFGGREIASLEYENIRSSAEVLSFDATSNDNPVRIRLHARYLVGAKLPPVKIPMKVLITDREGALLTGVVSFSTKGIGSGPEQGKVRGSQSLNFNVLNDGEHQLALSFAPNSNDGGIKRSDIDVISATVVANAPEIDDDYKALSAVLALVGFYLFMRSRRRKPSRDKTPPQKWGRG
ncbi:MAG: hypothetical protein QNJ29_07345 [Rhizobiaceae bacterium]|nr:hypothetical protein [Rhizobiaceae bacterium]